MHMVSAAICKMVFQVHTYGNIVGNSISYLEISSRLSNFQLERDHNRLQLRPKYCDLENSSCTYGAKKKKSLLSQICVTHRIMDRQKENCSPSGTLGWQWGTIMEEMGQYSLICPSSLRTVFNHFEVDNPDYSLLHDLDFCCDLEDLLGDVSWADSGCWVAVGGAVPTALSASSPS